MKKPARIEVVRRAYELWEKAGKPEGRDQEFYHQAERELETESEDPVSAGWMSDRLRNRYTKTCRKKAQDFLILPAQYSPDVEADETFRARSPTGPLFVGLAVRERTTGQ
jgi:hypothetical protein